MTPDRPRPDARPATPTPPAAEGGVLAGASPSREVLQRMTGRWGLLVLLALQAGTLRFGELRRRVDGVSERMLAQTLQALELDGLVERTAHGGVPPRVDYGLTPLGREAAERVRALADWIEASIPRIAETRRRREGDEGGPPAAP